MTPIRVQLRRTRGWRMPPNTIKVDRSTPWGNPYIVGAQGPAIECVYGFVLVCAGYIPLSKGNACADRSQALIDRLQEAKRKHWAPLRGKNLACWCKLGEPCHADVWLEIVNRRRKAPLDLDAILARYGWRVDAGKFFRIEEAA